MNEKLFNLPPAFTNPSFANANIRLVNIMVRFSNYLFDPQDSNAFTFIEPSKPSQSCFNLLWKFRAKSQGRYYLTITPQNPQNYGAALKLDNQRMGVDLLRLLAISNSQSISWKVMVSPNNEVFMALGHAISIEELSVMVGSLGAQVHKIVEKLMILQEIRMYSIQSLPVPENKNVSRGDSSNLREEIYKSVTMLGIQRQLRRRIRRDQSDQRFHKLDHIGYRQRLYYNLEEARQKAVQNISCVLKIQGVPIASQLTSSYKDQVNFESPIRNRLLRQQKRRESSQRKNVLGMKILKSIDERPSVGESKGNHCQIKICRYELQILGSINMEVNHFLMEKPGGCTLQYNKQFELVKKLCKDRNKETCLNSFLNELKFIIHLKNYYCEHIATFYVESQKLREAKSGKEALHGDESIIMDYYPETLEEYIQNGSKLTVIENLEILKQVADGLSWLFLQGICHRDIKPQNIMLNVNRVAKIIDFGSCCAAYSNKKASFEPKDSRLLTTLYYSRRFDEKSQVLRDLKYTQKEYERHPLFDCYSFGRVMEQMLGRHEQKLEEMGRLLRYIWECCKSEAPEDRPTYEQISMILSVVIRYLKSSRELSARQLADELIKQNC